jgi:protein-S-isoprenylcysteine O-methyltransferase Ste14
MFALMNETASLRIRALSDLALFVVAIAAMLFVPAWTVAWWQAWLFLAVFTAAVLAITLYFLKVDPALIERRLQVGPAAEKERRQQVIQTLASVALVAVFVVSGFDRQYGWSHLPIGVSLAGDLVVLLGLAVIFLVFRENSHAAATIWVSHDQPVISTGPYRYVRHPMYAGSLIMFLGIPLAVGSLWALIPYVALAILIAVRLINEERLLTADLPGYADYCAHTRARLIPHVW